jgi:DnaJ-domain-containing protein 1
LAAKRTSDEAATDAMLTRAAPAVLVHCWQCPPQPQQGLLRSILFTVFCLAHQNSHLFIVLAQDLYDVLGVKEDSAAAEIRKAYRRLAQKWHPDKAR